MEIALVILILGLLGSATWMLSKRSVHEQDGLAQTIHVLDGDTVIVRQGLRKHTLRLNAIDAPESDQPWGNTSTAGLVRMIGGKEVKIETHGLDIYKRNIASVFVFDEDKQEWIDVNARMLILGHAWLYPQFLSTLSKEKQVEMGRMQKWARSREVGLWKAEAPQPPWEWRRNQNKAA